MRNLLQSMSGVQLRLLWDRNIFIVLTNAASVADGALRSSPSLTDETFAVPAAKSFASFELGRVAS